MADDRSQPGVQEQLTELLDFPREDVDTEIKDWLPLQEKLARANLAIELIALANHGGGRVLFGYREDVSGWLPSGPCPHPLKHYAQDAINNIAKAYAEPPFECQVDHLASSAGNDHVVIRVPGGHRVPIRSKKDGPPGSRLRSDVYYTRRPGPESAPPQSGREWDELMRRCLAAQREELVTSFRNIVSIIGTGTEVAQSLVASAGQSELEAWENVSVQRVHEQLGAEK
jgi:hypothetical protein